MNATRVTLSVLCLSGLVLLTHVVAEEFAPPAPPAYESEESTDVSTFDHADETPLQPFAAQEQPGIELPSPWQMVTDAYSSIDESEDEEESDSRVSDEVLGILEVPDRPPLVWEENGDFLGIGTLSQGYELPTGAVWRPSLWIFGTNRFATQYFEDHQTTNAAEVVDRLDLFAQLNLSGTERLVLGLRPFDHEVRSVRRYTSYDFTNGSYEDGFNLYPQSLFFEGDFGEIFPNLDPYDSGALDYGFSVGRQAAFVQEGLFINADILDALTITRNTLNGNGVLNSRLSFMYAPGWVHRNSDATNYYLLSKDAQMFALLTETDFAATTINANFAYTYTYNQQTGDGVNFGLSAAQRLFPGEKTINSSFHVLGSFPVEQATAATGNGVLLFSNLSTTPEGTEDVAYFTTFWAIGQYVSPTRGVQNGGPVSPSAGILFARPQIGVFGSPLSSFTEDVVGGALGYQFIWDGIKKQLTFEVGGRQATSSSQSSSIGLGVLYQQAIGQHHVLILNGAIAKDDEVSSPAVGARFEWMTKF